MLMTVPFTAIISTPLKVPFQMRGLPGFQSDRASQPNIYFFVCSGLVRASQTFEAGAWMAMVFVTTSGWLIVFLLCNNRPFDFARIAFYGFFLVLFGALPKRFLKALLKCWGVE